MFAAERYSARNVIPKGVMHWTLAPSAEAKRQTQLMIQFQ
jgi:hypothetical protein